MCDSYEAPAFGDFCKSCQKARNKHTGEPTDAPKNEPVAVQADPGACAEYVKAPFGNLCKNCQKADFRHADFGVEEEPEAQPIAEEGTLIVVDIGRWSIKAGFAGYSSPSILMPLPLEYTEEKRQGKSAFQVKGWEVTEEDYKIIQANLTEIFQKLAVKTNPMAYPVLITEPVFAPKTYRNEIKSMLFDNFGAPGVIMEVQPVLTAYAYGLFTGLVVDIGYTATQILPLVDGFVIEAGVRRDGHISGRALTAFLESTLEKHASTLGAHPGTEDFHKIVERIKVEMVQIPEDHKWALTRDKEKFTQKFVSPKTEKSLSLHEELVDTAEYLFDKERLIKDQELKNLAQNIVQSIQACDLDVREKLFTRILLSGRSAEFKGLASRLRKEIGWLLAKTKYKAVEIIKESGIVEPLPRFGDLVWVGGSICSGVEQFMKNVTTLEDWNDPKQVARRARLKACPKCKEVTKVGDSVRALGRTWHPDCYRCHTCDKVLPPDHKLSHAMWKRGQPMCDETCAAKMFCPVCFDELPVEEDKEEDDEEAPEDAKAAAAAVAVVPPEETEQDVPAPPTDEPEEEEEEEEDKPLEPLKVIHHKGFGYHPQCWKCEVCTKVMVDRPYDEEKNPEGYLIKQGHALCSDKCSFTVICNECEEYVAPEEKGRQELHGIAYHGKCFVCPGCEKPMQGDDWKIHKGLPVHANCIKKVFCNQCGEHLLGDQERITAGVFHYHPKHLECVGCGLDWQDMRPVQMVKGRPVCNDRCAALAFCHVCQGFVPEDDLVEDSGLSWHKKCYRCDHCKLIIEGKGNKHNNKRFCDGCLDKITAK